MLPGVLDSWVRCLRELQTALPCCQELEAQAGETPVAVAWAPTAAVEAKKNFARTVG